MKTPHLLMLWIALYYQSRPHFWKQLWNVITLRGHENHPPITPRPGPLVKETIPPAEPNWQPSKAISLEDVKKRTKAKTVYYGNGEWK